MADKRNNPSNYALSSLEGAEWEGYTVRNTAPPTRSAIAEEVSVAEI